MSQEFYRALQESRLTDTENSDHLVMREHVARAIQDGGNKDESERIRTPNDWPIVKDLSLIRKLFSIGIIVFRAGGRGSIEFGSAHPSDATRESLLMMGLLCDGSHYDLIIFGEPSDEQLQGFVLFCCINPNALFCRLTPSQRGNLVRSVEQRRGVVSGQAVVIVGYSSGTLPSKNQ